MGEVEERTNLEVMTDTESYLRTGSEQENICFKNKYTSTDSDFSDANF